MAWSGMRGAVSLAVALALPLTTDTGDRFPDRDLILFLTFAVIFCTLVVQGLSLPPLIRHLGVSDVNADADEEIRARLVVTKAAIEQIDALAGEEWTRDDTVERMRAFYEYRRRRFGSSACRSPDLQGSDCGTLPARRGRTSVSLLSSPAAASADLVTRDRPAVASARREVLERRRWQTAAPRRASARAPGRFPRRASNGMP